MQSSSLYFSILTRLGRAKLTCHVVGKQALDIQVESGEEPDVTAESASKVNILTSFSGIFVFRLSLVPQMKSCMTSEVARRCSSSPRDQFRFLSMPADQPNCQSPTSLMSSHSANQRLATASRNEGRDAFIFRSTSVLPCHQGRECCRIRLTTVGQCFGSRFD